MKGSKNMEITRLNYHEVKICLNNEVYIVEWKEAESKNMLEINELICTAKEKAK